MTAVKSRTAKNAVDTWTNGTAGKTKQKNHRSTRLGVQSGGTGATSYIYFGFGAPRNSTLGDPTKLRLYTDGSWGGVSVTVTVKLLTSKWVARTTDDTDKPSSSGTGVSVTKSSTGDGDMWEWDLKTLLQDIADGQAWYGLEVTSNNATRRFFRSAQAGSLVPEFDLTWADEPDQPTSLVPGGGMIVSTSKPTMEMDYTDPTGGTLASAQVLVSASSGMTSPFDTGTVPVTGRAKARVDLSATAYAGLANAATGWWQGRVKDDSGVWSAYSNPTSFTRYDKGTLAINSPSVSTVNDRTPVIIATLTPPASPGGVALEKWQILVLKSNGRVVYDSEEQAATVGSNVFSVTVEDEDGEALLKRDVTYTLVTRAWDTLDRVDQPSDRPYVETSKTFTVEAGATAAVTGLELSYVATPPGVVATFQSATAPDFFNFTVNGQVVATNVESAPLFVSGTTYSYTFTRFLPNTDQTFGVIGVREQPNGESTEVTETFRPRVSGFWLIDRNRSRWVFLASTNSSGFNMHEDSSVHRALGGHSGVRITQALGGYEDSMSGVLVAPPELGRTLQEFVDEFLAMRAEPGKKRVLMGGTESFDVTTGNMQVRPTGDTSPGIRPFSFDYEQVSAPRVEVEL